MRYPNKKIFANFWLDEIKMTDDTKLCSLCGNTGIIKTSPVSPRGIQLGNYENCCICPNGMSIRYKTKQMRGIR